MTVENARARRWDYVRTQVDANKIKDSDATIERLGEEGWELAGVVFTQSHVHFWFKRPRS